MSCGIYVILFLKLWSYAQTNGWYREEYVKAAQSKRRLQRTSKLRYSLVSLTIRCYYWAKLRSCMIELKAF